MDPEDRLDPRSYNLSDIQLSYLLGQDIGTRTESRLETDVEDVVSNLDSRIQYLIEDIALFYSNDHLEPPDSPISGEDLTEISRNDDLYDPPVAYEGIKRDKKDQIKLAIHLGHVLNILYGSVLPDLDETMVAMSVLFGFNGGMLKDNWSGDSSIESFLGHLPDEDEYFESFEIPDDDTFEMLESVLADLDNASKVYPATDTENPDLREQFDQSSLTQTEPLIDEARSRLDDAGYPPYTSVVDAVFEEEVESDPEIQALEQLSDQLHSDINTLSDTGYQKAYAIDVFYAFYELGEYTDEDVGEIADAINTYGVQVRKFRNDFLGTESPWSDRPLLFEDQVGYTPTDYGSLVGHLLKGTEGQVEGEMELGESTYSVPSHKEIITTCHRYLFDEAGDEKRELVRSVLKDQFLQEDRGGES